MEYQELEIKIKEIKEKIETMNQNISNVRYLS